MLIIVTGSKGCRGLISLYSWDVFEIFHDKQVVGDLRQKGTIRWLQGSGEARASSRSDTGVAIFTVRLLCLVWGCISDIPGV